MHRAPSNHNGSRPKRRRPGAFVRPAAAVLSRLYLSALVSLMASALFPLALAWHPTVVMSGSMEPSIATGDIIAARPASGDDIRAGHIKTGMVVLADDPMRPGSLYTHRVVKILPDGKLVTKGDANATEDPVHLAADSVVGVEMLRVPYLGIPLQAAKAGNLLPATAFVLLTVLAVMVVRDDRLRDAVTRSAPQVFHTRAEARKAQRKNRSAFAVAAGRATTLAAVSLALVLSGSNAAFSGWTGTSGNTWHAASTFASNPQVASCGGATYTVNAGATVTCAVGTVSGTTKNYTLTVKGSGALVQWAVTADWSGIAAFSYAKAYGTGVADTGNIVQKSGYQIKGSSNGSTNPADSWNHAWVSSTKAAESFTVQVTTT